MSTDRKIDRAAKFNKNKESKNKQKFKRYIKEKKEYDNDFKDTRIPRNTDRSE